ncbi:AmpE protein [Marinospirillum celere]|uniref:AmpE protein n=1 Tax=Marinospirillum celere TaxID=1122252 RepID=A0A1I1GX83_9GAMM|nr:regulatory signaling modulator protein AmpE [Marinospirillum celere]SFC16284.1 AmpE protein [Marinospirillum celere]
MKFFVMLAVLFLREMPGQGPIRTLDRAFRDWQRWVAERMGYDPGASASFLVSILPWIFLLWLLLWWVEAAFWSLFTLLIHLLIVFYALGRRSELLWVERYMVAWRQGDFQAASYYAKEILEDDEIGEDPCHLHARVQSRLTYFAFDRLFLVLFWYLLLGPVGALLARLSEQALANARQDSEQGCDEQIERFQRVLEWPAARLLGLSLALLGRPLLGLKQFMADLLRWQLPTEDFLNRQLLTGYGVVSNGDEVADVCVQRPEIMTEEADQELLELKERIWKALALWVAITALGVIFWG